MSDRPRGKRRLSVGLLVGLLILIIGIGAVRRDRVYRPGETIPYDDFTLTLRGVNRSPVSGPAGDGPAATTVEYVIKLTVANRAEGGPFRLNRGSLALFDPETGKRYLVDGEAQRRYDQATKQEPPDPLVVKAGESATRSYVFRLPARVADPRLRVAPAGWSGMLLETLLFGSKEFRLP